MVPDPKVMLRMRKYQPCKVLLPGGRVAPQNLLLGRTGEAFPGGMGRV